MIMKCLHHNVTVWPNFQTNIPTHTNNKHSNHYYSFEKEMFSET